LAELDEADMAAVRAALAATKPSAMLPSVYAAAYAVRDALTAALNGSLPEAELVLGAAYARAIEHQLPTLDLRPAQPQYKWLGVDEILLFALPRAGGTLLGAERAALLIAYAPDAPRSRLRWPARGGRERLIVPLPMAYESLSAFI
jgi:hypothetical protein